ncbi:MAG: hypothetical protein ACW99F_20275 [Candidatus Hodarchaeales archaeon]|jgi:hypothetical protein
MKTRTLASILILVLALFIIVGSCATTKKAISEEDAMNVLCHTWVSEDYDKPNQPAKFIFTSDGKWFLYWRPTDTNPSRQGVYTITEKWTDSDGNFWCKIKWKNTITGGSGYEILKVSNSGNTLEQDWGYSEDIELDPEHYNYRIYTRQ